MEGLAAESAEPKTVMIDASYLKRKTYCVRFMQSSSQSLLETLQLSSTTAQFGHGTRI